MLVPDQPAGLGEFHYGKRDKDQRKIDAVCLPREDHQTEGNADRGEEHKGHEQDRQESSAVELFVREYADSEQRML